MSPISNLRQVTGLCAPSVLRPDWNHTQVSRSSLSGKARAISRLHGVAPGHGDIDLAHPLGDGRMNGRTADIGDAGAFLDEGDLFRRLDDARRHDVAGDIHQFRRVQHGLQSVAHGQR